MPSTMAAELHQHVVGELQRVGEDDALHRRVRDVALVPQRDVLEPGLQVAAQHAGEAAELLGLHRVALVRHRARALLGAGAERLLDLADLGALEVADLGGERLDGGAHRRARVEQLGVAVAGDHLRGRHRREPERLAHVGLDRGIDVGVGADRARELADGDGRPGPGPAARGRGAPAWPRGRAWRRTWWARRARRGCARPWRRRGSAWAWAVMATWRAAAASITRSTACTSTTDEGGVDDVAGGEAVVEPGARPGPRCAPGPRRRRRRRRARWCAPARGSASTVKSARSRTATASGGGHDAQLGPGLGGEDLDLQPGPEPGLVGEEGGDLRQCVALYQGGPSSCRTLYEPEMARTGPGRDASGSDRGDPRRARRSIGGDELHEALERARRRGLRGVRPALVRRVPRPTAEGRGAAAVHPLLPGHRRGADAPSRSLSRADAPTAPPFDARRRPLRSATNGVTPTSVA